MNQWFKQGLENIWLPYTQMQIMAMPIKVKETKECKIILEDGTKIIDGISSWWSTAHGYNHPHIIRAMEQQLRQMPHIMLAGIAHQPAYKLANRLAHFVNWNSKNRLEKVFFSDSGSTAVEVAMKMAVQFFLNQGDDKKSKIISFYDGYHGDTMGGMSLCDTKNGMHAKFKNYLPKQLITKIPRNKKDLEKFENFIVKNKAKAAAVIIEPLIQCAAGMKFHSPEILQEICNITQKHGVLFIVDECATGFYRTGDKFAFHTAKINPDMVIVGKALTGGTITLAATITTNKIFNGFLDNDLDKALMHGPTFMGNPLACSAANASLDLFEQENYIKKIKKIESYFEKELPKFEKYSNVKEIRIKGAVAVIELKKYDWDYMFKLREKFLEKGIWLRPFVNVIYIMPAYIIKEEELQKIITAIHNILKNNA